MAGREKSRWRFVTLEVQTHLATMIEVAATRVRLHFINILLLKTGKDPDKQLYRFNETTLLKGVWIRVLAIVCILNL